MAVGHDQTNKQTNPKTTQNQNHFCTDLYKSHFNSRGQSFLSFALEHRLDSAGRLRKVFLNHTSLMSWASDAHPVHRDDSMKNFSMWHVKGFTVFCLVFFYTSHLIPWSLPAFPEIKWIWSEMEDRGNTMETKCILLTQTEQRCAQKYSSIYTGGIRVHEWPRTLLNAPYTKC